MCPRAARPLLFFAAQTPIPAFSFPLCRAGLAAPAVWFSGFAPAPLVIRGVSWSPLARRTLPRLPRLSCASPSTPCRRVLMHWAAPRPPCAAVFPRTTNPRTAARQDRCLPCRLTQLPRPQATRRDVPIRIDHRSSRRSATRLQSWVRPSFSLAVFVPLGVPAR